VQGFNGEAVRTSTASSRAQRRIRNFALNGRLGRDTPVTGDLRGRAQGQGREVIYLETSDAGAFFASPTPIEDDRRPACAGHGAPTTEPGAKRPDERHELHGQDRGRAWSVSRRRGRRAERRVVLAVRANSPATTASSRPRRRGEGPDHRRTIEGASIFPATSALSGTSPWLYGLNNMFGQIPIVACSLAWQQ